MKILNVNASIDPVNGGGTAERTVQMSKYLAKTGIECEILTLDLGLTPDVKRSLSHNAIHALPCLFERFYIPMPSFRCCKTILKCVNGSDLIHLMGHWTVINVLVFLFAVCLSKKYVVCPAGALPIFGRSKKLKKIYNMVIGSWMIRRASLCIAVTTDEISQFEAYGVGRHKIKVIPNGIESGPYINKDVGKFRSAHNLERHPIIFFLGRLNPIKGPDLLLQAFFEVREDLKEYHLVFAGIDEGMQSGLRGYAQKRGIDDRVHFIGFISGAKKSQGLHAADFLVIPSRKEAMSIVVLEAGIVGKPVLLTDQCGLNEIAKIDGGMVVAASIKGLSEGLKAMANNKERLNIMGKNLKQLVNEQFVWDEVVKKYVDLYQQILNNKHI